MYCPTCSYNNPINTKVCKNCELDLQAGASDTGRAAEQSVLTYAGFWARFFAAFLDLLVLGAGVILLLLSIAGLIAYSGRDSILHDPQDLSRFYWAIICMAVAYSILMESGTRGATLGKRWMNLKVLDTNGNRLTVWLAARRLLARAFSYLSLMIGFLLQPFTRRKQALHDLLAGTIVVRANESKKIAVMASLLVLFYALMVPVLALVATAGLPVYRQTILKAQLRNGMHTGREATLAVARFWRNNGRVPYAIGEAGANISSSPHVAGIDINQQNGEVTVTFSEMTGKDISNKHLVFTPTLEADHGINWKCSSNDIETQFLPASCK
jgi:uncharacterized RDD family membrane protein YckC